MSVETYTYIMQVVNGLSRCACMVNARTDGERENRETRVAKDGPCCLARNNFT